MNKAPDEMQIQFRAWLQDEFAKRCRVNSRFSIRAFAKQLNVNQSTLTQILNGKRRLSSKAIKSIEQKVGSQFHFNNSNTLDFKYTLLSLDAFTVISDWYHYAILEMTALKDFDSDIKWVSKKLGISPSEAHMAIERLLRLGMLVKTHGTLKRSKTNVSNYVEGVTSGAHKEFQRQVIAKAMRAIDSCPQERKDITAITIPTNSKKLKDVKEKIRKFRREICDYLEDGNHDSVFQLCVQLYPLTDV